MSTVFKLKAAILMVCTFVVMSVSNVWGQKLTPVLASGTAINPDGGDVNWVVRGDDAAGAEVNNTIGIKYGDVKNQDYQYAFFSYDATTGKLGFLGTEYHIKDEGEQTFYTLHENQDDGQINLDDFGYDVKFRNVKNILVKI